MCIRNNQIVPVSWPEESLLEAVKSYKIFQLPSQSTLQLHTGAFLHEAGASSSCITSQVANFMITKMTDLRMEKRELKGDGVLIFDEVKVVCQLM